MRKVLVLGSAASGLALALFAASPAAARGAPVVVADHEIAIAAIPTLAIVAQDITALLTVEPVALKDPTEESIVACSPTPSTIVVVGIARDCSVWEVVAFTEKVFGARRTFTAILSAQTPEAAERMIAAVETRTRYTVLRM